MSRFPLIVSFTAALMTSACISTPDVGPAPQLKTVADQQTFAAPAADWPRTDWWRAYGDPQLDALIAEGLQGSPTSPTSMPIATSWPPTWRCACRR